MCVRCGTGTIAWCTDPYRHGESTEPVMPGQPPVPVACADGAPCVNHCGSGPCSRRCQVCQRLAGTPTMPCPSCPDAPRRARLLTFDEAGRQGWVQMEPADRSGTEPRRWLYGLTADEWLHLASEGKDSEIPPCRCGVIAELRDLLREFLAFQSPADVSWQVHAGREILRAVGEREEWHGHDLGNTGKYPLLNRVLAGIRAAVEREDGEQ